MKKYHQMKYTKLTKLKFWFPILFAVYTNLAFGVSDTIFNINRFGAIGDGVTINTEAINKAIAACTESGGGTVIIPKGTYLSGTVFLESNITLFLEEGSMIKGCLDLNTYASFNPRKEKPDKYNSGNWQNALILAVGVENVTIKGTGVIDGDHVTDENGEENMRGPHLLLFRNCRKVTLTEVTLQRAGNYNFLAQNLNDATFKNLKINAGSDGIHIRKGKNITIEKCIIHSGDDAIAGGNWVDFSIAECTLNSSCNGVRLIGPATNLKIQNCEIYGPGKFEHRVYGKLMRRDTYCGITLMPGTWGKSPGALEKITIQDITIDNVGSPINIILNEENTGKEILVERITATNIYTAAFAVESWAGGVFEDVTFRDINVEYLASDNPATAVIFNLRRPGIDTRPIPCWAFFALNVNNLTLENIKFSYRFKEIRPAFIFNNIKQLNLRNVTYVDVKNAKTAILNNVEKINNTNVTPQPLLLEEQK